MLVSRAGRYHTFSTMQQLPTWKELVADTACCKSNRLKVVSRVSTNSLHSLVFCHQSTENVASQEKTILSHNSECFIGKLFQSAVKTFIRSQIEHCSELKVSISGNNSDLLQGRVRSLKISAKGAVYKGIYLTDVQLAASDIKLKPRASRILQEPSNVRASIRVDEEDLSSSLASPLLGKVLQKLLSERFHITSNAPDMYLSFKDGAVQLQKNSFLKNVRFACASLNNTKEDQKTALRLQVEDDGKSLRISCTNTGIAGIDEHAFVRKFSLGPDVCIQKLEVQPSQILLDGHFLVRP